MERTVWIVLIIFVWVLKFFLWLPVMTFELAAGRATGEMRAVFGAAVATMWPVFGLLLWYAQPLGLPFFVVGAMYLAMGIFGFMGIVFAHFDALGSRDQPA